MKGPIGIIPDLQIPFALPDSLQFMKAIKKKYKIPNNRWVCIGDELDSNTLAQWDQDPDGDYSPKTELQTAIEQLKAWYKVFPQMVVLKSNHSMRLYRKAEKIGIPSMCMRDLSEILEINKQLFKDFIIKI